MKFVSAPATVHAAGSTRTRGEPATNRATSLKAGVGARAGDAVADGSGVDSTVKPNFASWHFPGAGHHL
ncbi:hypothetical protein ACFOYW_17140 [Gryllotalpicola reticulitermitis]|uniref:Uncharacterized protein n=1 Tax=Gryllotalpicola reticulitermitis TaxID=1184153 RepID=A0ABV8QA03_9MICO